MKLEWGKKVVCPACAIPFYDMQKTDLSCPYCSYSFNYSEVNAKKIGALPIEDLHFDEKIDEFEDGFEEFHDEINDIDDDASAHEIGVK